MLHLGLSLEPSGTGSVDEPRHRLQELPLRPNANPNREAAVTMWFLFPAVVFGRKE